MAKCRTGRFLFCIYGFITAFLGGMIRMFDAIKKDVRAVRERDPAARNSFEVLLLSSG